jgi:dynein heavy chain
MDEITQFLSDYSKRLSRPINDLEDVRSAMAALEDVRQHEIRIDMTLGPIEVRFINILTQPHPCTFYR